MVATAVAVGGAVVADSDGAFVGALVTLGATDGDAVAGEGVGTDPEEHPTAERIARATATASLPRLSISRGAIHATLALCATDANLKDREYSSRLDGGASRPRA
jgi:hypothetical protein